MQLLHDILEQIYLQYLYTFAMIECSFLLPYFSDAIASQHSSYVGCCPNYWNFHMHCDMGGQKLNHVLLVWGQHTSQVVISFGDLLKAAIAFWYPNARHLSLVLS